jgi:dTDP-4-dehydrorhamnose reductase
LTKVLILGATGMLGHKLYQQPNPFLEITGTVRGDLRSVSRYGFYQPDNIIPRVDALKIETVDRAISKAKPDVVVNCIGVVKALVETAGITDTMQLNALFPHQLYEICSSTGIRLIQVSTDCVFSGKKGSYNEDDKPDAEDFYGQSKYLGEVTDEGALTIRTSIIGRELAGSNGLLEWFIVNRGGKVSGYTNAIFSGFPTMHLAGIIGDIITKNPELCGLYHIASEPINKHDLLSLINKAIGLNIEIEKYPDVRIDRSLDGKRFNCETGFKPLPWDKMIAELAEDAKAYTKWR